MKDIKTQVQDILMDLTISALNKPLKIMSYKLRTYPTLYGGSPRQGSWDFAANIAMILARRQKCRLGK